MNSNRRRLATAHIGIAPPEGMRSRKARAVFFAAARRRAAAARSRVCAVFCFVPRREPEAAAPLPSTSPAPPPQVAIALDGGETNALMVQWAMDEVLSPSDSVALVHSAYGLSPEEARSARRQTRRRSRTRRLAPPCPSRLTHRACLIGAGAPGHGAAREVREPAPAFRRLAGAPPPPAAGCRCPSHPRS